MPPSAGKDRRRDGGKMEIEKAVKAEREKREQGRLKRRRNGSVEAWEEVESSP